MNRTLITVAPTGAEVAKADWPQLPTTLDELVAEAKACEAAGAGMIHVHIRDEDHRPTLDLGRLRETVSALRENTGLIVQLSTGGSVHDPLDARLAVLAANPDSCSLTCGTVNFGDDVFSNPWPFMVELYRRTQLAQVVPEFELFDHGHIAALGRLLDEYGLPYGGKVHADLVLGVPGGLPANVTHLVTAVQALPSAVTSWSATGIGRGHLPVLAATLGLGGHLRVGMEDNLFFAPRRPVTGNAELVARAATLANHLQRPVMSPTQARELIGISL
jgi:3-keto-5-aminohexanoate cleavage enzyme